MLKKLLQKADRYLARKRRRQTWRKVVGVLGCIVVFCTVYALILPALTMEKTADCGKTEHTHNEDCYSPAAAVVKTVPVCSAESLQIHCHTGDCYNELGELICGYADFVIHQHDSSCYDEDGNLWCTLPEVEAHTHDDSCYAMEELICEKTEIIPHEHTSECFDENGYLICGMQQVLEHTHTEECFQTVEETTGGDVLICQIPEHTHTEECYVQEEETQPTQSDRVEAIFAPRDTEAEQSEPGNIADHLTSARIEINGKPYDGVSALNPGEQFAVVLQWQLERKDLSKTLTYTYKLPEQIQVKDVGETVLYDEINNRKGVYSIKDGVLTVTYDNVSDLNTTTFTLNATWDQEKIGQETTVQWNEKLPTAVKFDNSQIAATKAPLQYKTIEDGSLIAEYAVNVAANGAVENITLTDTLTSEKFHFCQGYYEADGKKFDYRYKIINADGSAEYQYGNFPDGTFDMNGNQLKDTITFPGFNLSKGQTYTVEYAVKLDADDRFELDQNQAAAGLTNTATASYPFGDETISSSVTVTDTYRAEEKWVVKERGNLGEGDTDQDTNVPWKVTVNPTRDYDMGGAVISDNIRTEGVVYNTDKPITITSTTDENSATATPQWIELSDQTVSAIRSVGGQAIDLLYKPEYQNYLNEINKAVGHEVGKEELSSYVFVGKSQNQFVWFAPKTGTPTTYELSYTTDISKAASNTLINSAQAGWKQWTAGVVDGSFLQEIGIEKKNDGAYQKGDDYFVDWTVTLDVPAGRNAIPDVFLYDVLPYHKESDGYDQLEGLNVNGFDYERLQENEKEYLNEIAKDAFSISTDSEEGSVKQVVGAAKAYLGHPVSGLSDQDYRLYESDDTLRGQFPIVNGGDTYSDKRITPTRFGIWLGTLPATTGKNEGYKITVRYTTKVDPKLIEDLNGRAYGYNTVGLMQRQGETDVLLGTADASYWADHYTAQNTLAKSVVDFDSKKKIVTYQVNINPDASLDATGNAEYILRDVLNLPGAGFIENSFQLSFPGTVSEDAAFTWDDSEKTVLWRADGGKVDLSADLAAGMKDLVENTVQNPKEGSSSFSFSVQNTWNVLALQAPEEFKGKLAPMVLTYQVQLPDGAELPTKETITNSVTLSMKPYDGSEVLLDGVKTEFDYTSALHKRLSAAPDGGNGYTAAFVINIDKSVDEWKNTGDTFTVSDEMSKSLVVDITSIKVYGVKSDGEEMVFDSGYTTSYDDRSSESKNFLSVTITDNNEYTKYRIEYSTRVQGGIGEEVHYDNVAKVEGTEMKSEEITEDVYIQKQDGNVDETNYEVKLLKFDAGNTAVGLKATFTLYAWENGDWIEKLSGLTTDKNGELVLNNTTYSELGLGPNIWYKLVETNAPEGYLKGTTYFHIGQKGEDEKLPDGVESYTTIPLKGGTHQVPNYKASLRLHKIDEEKGESTSLTGAEFTLYETPDCSKALLTAKEERPGIYSFELTGLTAGTTYYLKETKAPDGYQLSDTVYTVTFDQEGNVTLMAGGKPVATDSGGAYLIENKSGVELPETGGPGIMLYTISGIVLMAGALMYDIIRRRRRI